jgi:hypothetical protein
VAASFSGVGHIVMGMSRAAKFKSMRPLFDDSVISNVFGAFRNWTQLKFDQFWNSAEILQKHRNFYKEVVLSRSYCGLSKTNRQIVLALPPPLQ